VVSVAAPEAFSGEGGVELDLVHDRHEVRLGEEALEVVGLDVRDTDRPGAPLRSDALHAPADLDDVAHRRERPVDEDEVISSTLKASSVASNARSTSATSPAVFVGVLVRETSERARPDSAIACPTSRSLWSISAVSMWR